METRNSKKKQSRKKARNERNIDTMTVEEKNQVLGNFEQYFIGDTTEPYQQTFNDNQVLTTRMFRPVINEQNETRGIDSNIGQDFLHIFGDILEEKKKKFKISVLFNIGWKTITSGKWLKRSRKINIFKLLQMYSVEDETEEDINRKFGKIHAFSISYID